MQFIHVTKKGNVKLVDNGGVTRKAYFVPSGGQAAGCGGCVLHDAGFCHRSPCSDNERGERGLPYVDGNFSWAKP